VTRSGKEPGSLTAHFALHHLAPLRPNYHAPIGAFTALAGRVRRTGRALRSPSRLQKGLRAHSNQWFDSVTPNSKAHEQIVCHMAEAVGEIADIVKTRSSKHPSINPMLGSKVLSFFFPISSRSGIWLGQGKPW